MGIRTVYLVDDDEPVRESLRALLGVRSDLLIHCYKTGDAFLEQTDDLDPGVLLLDYNMSGISGLDVLGTIDRSKFMTIMLTAHASVGLAVEVIRAGAVEGQGLSWGLMQQPRHQMERPAAQGDDGPCRVQFLP